MTSDRGPQFVSDLWAAMSNLLGTSLHPTTALVERMHRTLKGSLKARLNSPHWVDELPWVLLGLRTTPKEDLEASPADMVYGSALTVPGDFVPDSAQVPVQAHLRDLREKMGNLKPTPTGTHRTIRSNIPDRLAQAGYVFIRTDARRTPLQTPYEGPYSVVAKTDKYFTVQLGNRQDNVSIDRLKAAEVEEQLPVPVAQPTRCGCPPVVPVVPGPRLAPPVVPQVPGIHHPQGPAAQRVVPELPRPPPVPAIPPKGQQSEDTPPSPPRRPTYAEVATRSGRITKLPQRFRD